MGTLRVQEPFRGLAEAERLDPAAGNAQTPHEALFVVPQIGLKFGRRDAKRRRKLTDRVADLSAI